MQLVWPELQEQRERETNTVNTILLFVVNIAIICLLAGFLVKGWRELLSYCLFQVGWWSPVVGIILSGIYKTDIPVLVGVGAWFAFWILAGVLMDR